MKKNISIAIPKIGNEVKIIFGKADKNTKNIHIEDGILSEWTKEFLTEFDLLPDADLGNNEIHGFLEITKEQMVYRVQGEITFSPKLECVRSLTEFRQQLTATINCFFVQQNYQKSQTPKSNTLFLNSENKDELELSLEDLETYYFSGNQLILDEVIMDSLYCAIPELPLCRENCRGLCSDCGTDLNLQDLDGNDRVVAHKKSCHYYSAIH